MRVVLLSHTPNALELLLFTKQTRLHLSPETMEKVQGWSMEKKLEELDYMRQTIQSSWEMVDYVFLIQDVSRAFTHQLVRHRHASYAQQAQRVVNMADFDFIEGPAILDPDHPERARIYRETMGHISGGYMELVSHGVPAQDARGVLPTNIATNIVMKANLRSLHDMALKRLCVKAQGEAQDVFRSMVDRVLEVHPYFDKFLRVWCATYGTCQFHSFPVQDCPTKPHVYNPDTGVAYGGSRPLGLQGIYDVWKQNRAEAQPSVERRPDDAKAGADAM